MASTQTLTGAHAAEKGHAQPARLSRRYDQIGNWVNRQFQRDAFGKGLRLYTAACRLGRRRADDWRAAVTVVGRRGHVLVGLTRCYRRLARKVGTSGCVPVVFFPARSRGGPTGRVNASPVQSWTPKRPHSRDTRVRSEVLRPLPWSLGLPGCL
ncbi:hypothetical protein [Streptomyces sp. NBC_00118]|uniref:hypothetical protein n=1 Tax=unclassified Streptomyces TaxID=2593676 RepID=UPI00325612E3